MANWFCEPLECNARKMRRAKSIAPLSRGSRGGRSDSRRWSKFLWEIALAVRYGDSCCEVRLLSSATNCPLSTISLDMRPAAGMWAFPYRATCALGLLFFRRAASVVSIAHAYYWTHRTTMPTRMTAVPGYRASWLGDLARNR